MTRGWAIRGLRVLPFLLLASYPWFTARQIAAWRSELSLWSYAASVSPYKPRVAHAYGLALLADGQKDAGLKQLQRAQRVAALPHVPAWDKQITQERVTANIRALRLATTR